MAKQRTINTASGQELISFIARIERVREEKKGLANDEKLIFAEAKSAGFSALRMGECIRIRAMNPHSREEAESQLDMYLHAIGMAREAPLFRSVGLMNVDTAAREQVIAAVKLLVPASGEFILRIGGNPLRIWRDQDGEAHAEDWREPEAKRPRKDKGGGYRAPEGKDVPEVSAEDAETLGRAAWKSGMAIIRNPFPWDDQRRARWDRGWRLEGGSDGMGPDGKED